jgi:hypothetical protein
MQTIAWNSKDLVDQYRYLSSGHFFDDSAMRFFKSRVTDNYRRIDNNTALFITTESGPVGKVRFATVRIAKLIAFTREDGQECFKIDIRTLGDFNMLSMYRARKAMNNYLVEGK